MHYMVCLKRKKGDMIVLWQVYISKVPNIVTPSDSASLRLKSLYRINSSNTITEWTNKETTFNFIGGEQASGDKVFFAPSCDIFHTTISHLHPVQTAPVELINSWESPDGVVNPYTIQRFSQPINRIGKDSWVTKIWSDFLPSVSLGDYDAGMSEYGRVRFCYVQKAVWDNPWYRYRQQMALISRDVHVFHKPAIVPTDPDVLTY